MLCLLLLRGPQTPGELRSRSDRMFSFDDLAQVQSTLERLAAREQALAIALARQPGAREIRWAHLLGGPQAGQTAGQTGAPDSAASGSALSEEVAELRAALAALEARVQALEHRS